VTVITDPPIIRALALELEAEGETSLATRVDLARKVFAATSTYDGMITTNSSAYLRRPDT